MEHHLVTALRSLLREMQRQGLVTIKGGDNRGGFLTLSLCQEDKGTTGNVLEDSVPSFHSGTGSSAAEKVLAKDSEENVWSVGVTLLTQAGVKERQARSLLGRGCKVIGEAKMLEAVKMSADKADPVSYLSAAIQRRTIGSQRRLAI